MLALVLELVLLSSASVSPGARAIVSARASVSLIQG